MARPPPLPKLDTLVPTHRRVEFLAIHRLPDGRWQLVEGVALLSECKPIGPPQPADAEMRAVAHMHSEDEARRLKRLAERGKRKAG